MTFPWGGVFLSGKPLGSTSFSKTSRKLMEDIAKPLLQWHLAPWAVQSATGVIKTWQPRWKWRVWRDCGSGCSSYTADAMLQFLSKWTMFIRYGMHTKKCDHKVVWWIGMIDAWVDVFKWSCLLHYWQVEEEHLSRKLWCFRGTGQMAVFRCVINDNKLSKP